MLLRYTLHIDPRWYPHACYALDVLLDGLGLAGAPTDDATTADLVYAPTRPAGMAAEAVWIRAGNETDWARTPVGIGWLDAMPVLYQGACPGPGSEAHNNIPADLLYATYALVGGVAEQQALHSGWGPTPSIWRSWERSGAVSYPVVALYVHYIATRLKRYFGTAWKPVPRWPSGKEYAVVLAHAVGRPPAQHAPSSYYRRRWRADVKRRAWGQVMQDLGGLGRALVREWSHPTPASKKNALESFVSNGQGREAGWGVKSCFYVAAATEPSGLRVGYGARRSALIDALRHAVDAGWEVGLLASMDEAIAPGRIVAERQWLEAALGGYRVRGVHFGPDVLDRQGPFSSWRTYAEAGFSYGTAARFEGSAGPGHGMIWPFLPSDRNNANRFEPYHVLPVGFAIETPGTPPEEDEQRLRRHIAQAFSYGGAVVLDGAHHQPGHDGPQGWGYPTARIMKDLLLDDRIFWATPGELASWWRERRRFLATFHRERAGTREHGDPSVSGRPVYPRGAPASTKQPPSAA